ncbi:saccharopine dehydrogenase NADP-binding domain-containing protein [Myxococcota bacterium]|nr:saccharopine dehydrogenase NADP-binding domain-containing protein [Myxococcota bacterium]
MTYRYAVLGAGMQGTAAAYDLARFGDAAEVRLFDVDLSRAEASARRVNELVGAVMVRPAHLDARDPSSVQGALEGVHACLSAVPYFLNVALAEAAIAAGACFNDLGGNTNVVEQELALDAKAKARGVSVVPDCGVAPGMANTLAVHGIESLDVAEHVHMRCGGLPQNKALPLGYKKLFSLEGLTNEYFGKAIILRDGKVAEVDTFEELERFVLPEPIGEVEAFTTSGGASTAPYTFAGKLKTYDYKTIRYPGHYEKLKLFKDLGFLELAPVTVKGASVVPRDVFHAIMDRAWDHPAELDLLVLRVDVLGTKDGRASRYRAEIIDRQDPKTGFSAMERTTAFAAAIVTSLQAHGHTPKGAVPLEKAVGAAEFVRELGRRDIPFSITVEPIA